MMNFAALGWDPKMVGELDHRRLKAPTVKLRSAKSARMGDALYCIDFRLRRPNAGEYLPAAGLHSIEHFLLEGLQRYLPKSFVSVGVMGCQTGFYLVTVNEGRAARICDVLASILTDMQNATCVPYACIKQCGHYRNHDLVLAKEVAREVLERRTSWLDAA